MSFIDLLRSRRSIRKYKNKKLDGDVIDQLKEALLRSPSSRNRTPWDFIFVDDAKIIKKLSVSKVHGAEFIDGCALAIIIAGDENISDVWIEDCAIAAVTLQYQVHEFGLGSCWAQIRGRKREDGEDSEQYIQDLLKMPKNLKILCIIGIGHPDEIKSGTPKVELNYKKIHNNSYRL